MYCQVYARNVEQVMWPRFIVSKWLLRRKSGGEKFITDTESETDDEQIGPLRPSKQRGTASVLSSPAVKQPKASSGMLMRGQSETLWTQYTQTREYRVFVGTWNVGGRTPPDDLDLEDWLDTRESSSDIYVIGFQEIVPLKAGKVFGSEDGRPAAEWDALIRKTLNKTPAQTRIEKSCSVPSSDFSTHLPFLDPEWNTKDDATLPMPNLVAGFEVEKALEKLDKQKPPNLAEMNGSSKWSSSRQRYRRVASKQMVGIYISIWVKSELRRHIHDLNVSCVGCGIMGCLGNKGSVSVSMTIHQTTFCFVCTHLASGEKDGDEVRRNGDVAEILKRTHFPRHSTHRPPLPQTILSHDRIIWFGDLNYRLSLEDSKARSLIDKKDWKTLQQSDQLKMEQKAGRVFEGWREGYIDFAPTYKYAANSDKYCGVHDNPGEKRRVPAWCDRILWYGKGLKQVFYVRGENRFSDHRPVSALFSAQIETLCNRKLERTLGLSIKLLEAQNLLSQEIGKLPATHPEVVIGKIGNADKADKREDLHPVLNEMQTFSHNLGSMLSEKLNAWDKESNFDEGIGTIPLLIIPHCCNRY
eukprot:Gb_30199 [translate_table: standard]